MESRSKWVPESMGPFLAQSRLKQVPAAEEEISPSSKQRGSSYVHPPIPALASNARYFLIYPIGFYPMQVSVSLAGVSACFWTWILLSPHKLCLLPWLGSRWDPDFRFPPQRCHLILHPLPASALAQSRVHAQRPRFSPAAGNGPVTAQKVAPHPPQSWGLPCL